MFEKAEHIRAQQDQGKLHSEKGVKDVGKTEYRWKQDSLQSHQSKVCTKFSSCFLINYEERIM